MLNRLQWCLSCAPRNGKQLDAKHQTEGDQNGSSVFLEEYSVPAFYKKKECGKLNEAEAAPEILSHFNNCDSNINCDSDVTFNHCGSNNASSY